MLFVLGPTHESQAQALRPQMRDPVPLQAEVYPATLPPALDVHFQFKAIEHEAPSEQVERLKEAAARRQARGLTPDRSKRASAFNDGTLFDDFGLRDSGGFQANLLRQVTPPDNAIAISRQGYLISADNYSLSFYNPDGSLEQELTHDGLVQDLNLSGYYDPRLLYDTEADRFIYVIMAGASNPVSTLVIGFSKAENPALGWNFFTINGDVEDQGEFFDYPNIAISQDELFVTGNMFRRSAQSGSTFSNSVILQIDKEDGYQGSSLNYALWSGLVNNNGIPIFNPVPIPSASETPYPSGQYFIAPSAPEGSDRMLLMEIDGPASDSSTSLQTRNLRTDFYRPGADAPMRNSSDRLSVGDPRIEYAYQLRDTAFFVLSHNFSQGFNGIYLGRFPVSGSQVDVFEFGQVGVDYAYPSIQPIALANDRQAVVLQFLASSSSRYPESRATLFADDRFQNSILLQAGRSEVQIIRTGTERWGDYSDMVTQYTDQGPIIWAASCFGIQDNNAGKSFATWITRLQSTQVSAGLSPEARGPSRPEVQLQLHPNPVRSDFWIDFRLPAPGHLRAELVSTDGRTQRILYNRHAGSNQGRLRFNRRALSPGHYWVRLSWEGQLLQSIPLQIR
mgnify:CR=1 FL=1